LGWYIEESHGDTVVYHPGGLLGYMGRLTFFVGRNVVVINLFNNDFLLSHLVEDALASIALDQPWKPVLGSHGESLPHTLAECVGRYDLDEASTFEISVENGELYYQESNQPKCRAYPYSDNGIYVREINTRIRFDKTNEGEISYTGFFGLFLVRGKRL